jgi:hypothetical protein
VGIVDDMRFTSECGNAVEGYAHFVYSVSFRRK